jgi:glycosyltransferase A (GT-A) superfamily protein (DUF2064 family)
VQALGLFNSRFTQQQAELLARRCQREAGDEIAPRLRRAFELAFGRPPAEFEEGRAVPLVSQHGLTSLCRALFNANEFLFIP